VYAVADGRIVRVLAREGDSVEPGQTLAEFEVAGHMQQLASPLRAIVLGRHCEVGDYALAAEHGATGPLFELADPSRTELRVEVEEPDAFRLATELSATITALGTPNATARGRVARVSARLERRTIGADDARVRADGLVRVASVAWRDAQPTWPVGSRAEAVIELRRKIAATRLPRAALSVRDGRTVALQPVALWTREIPVEIVSADDSYAEVLGIALGTDVVIPASMIEPPRATGTRHVDSSDSTR
jgi:pyruvate/2-oxoglutarate dehydrogenase complex dihydrolipoamide acyltransferase (E2) component